MGFGLQCTAMQPSSWSLQLKKWKFVLRSLSHKSNFQSPNTHLLRFCTYRVLVRQASLAVIKEDLSPCLLDPFIKLTRTLSSALILIPEMVMMFSEPGLISNPPWIRRGKLPVDSTIPMKPLKSVLTDEGANK